MVFNEDLKYRMYILVERHLSPLDKGIQSAHAVAEYYNECRLWNKKEELKNQKMNKPLTREQAQKLEEKEKKEQLKNQRKKMFKVVKN